MAGLISNGTYVLGDPNTRDLYLGKGLKDGFEGDKYYIATDETVLWEGNLINTTDTANLSEAITNFDRIKILVKTNRDTAQAKQWFEFDTDANVFNIVGGLNSSSNGLFLAEIVLRIDSSNNMKYVAGSQWAWGGAVEASLYGGIYKVVGINRKREEV